MSVANVLSANNLNVSVGTFSIPDTVSLAVPPRKDYTLLVGKATLTVASPATTVCTFATQTGSAYIIDFWFCTFNQNTQAYWSQRMLWLAKNIGGTVTTSLYGAASPGNVTAGNQLSVTGNVAASGTNIIFTVTGVNSQVINLNYRIKLQETQFP